LRERKEKTAPSQSKGGKRNLAHLPSRPTPQATPGKKGGKRGTQEHRKKNHSLKIGQKAQRGGCGYGAYTILFEVRCQPKFDFFAQGSSLQRTFEQKEETRKNLPVTSQPGAFFREEMGERQKEKAINQLPKKGWEKGLGIEKRRAFNRVTSCRSG